MPGALNYCIIEQEKATVDPESAARFILVHGPYGQGNARAMLASFAVKLKAGWQDHQIKDMSLEFDGQDLLTIKNNDKPFRQFKVQAMIQSRKLV